MWNALIRFSHCLITLASITFVLWWVNVSILVMEKMGDECFCGKKTSLFPLATQIRFLYAYRSEVNNGKYFPVLNTPSKALCDSPLWPVWASVQQGSKKQEFDSLSAPHSHSTLLQPIYKSDHKRPEEMTTFYFSGYLKFTAGGKKSFSCLSLFYCVLHKCPN